MGSLNTTFAIGSFIAFPALGSGSNTITVYAENRINVERTLRSLNYLVRMISLSLSLSLSQDLSLLSYIDLQGI